MKICNVCKVEERMPLTRATMCYPCYREYDKKRYYRDKDKRQAKDSKRYHLKKDEILAQARQRLEDPEVYARSMYRGMQYRCGRIKTYKHRKVLLSLKEFLDLLKETRFLEIHKAWLESGRQRKLSPSVDRIDNSGHYEIGNIQVITQSENSSKKSKIDYAK